MPALKRLIIALSLASFLLISQSGCEVHGSEVHEIVYQPVAAVTVERLAEFAVKRSFTGVARPAQSADLAFEFSGTVSEVMVNEGDRVEADELVARLDTSLLEIERRQLQAQQAEAQANQRLILANLDRQGSLETDGYASRQRRDELESGRDANRARIAHLQAALDGNLVRQEKYHLRAPFSGVVGERFLQRGSTASPGVPAIRVLETDRMEARIGVPRQLAATVSKGDVVTLSINGRTVLGDVLAVGAELKAKSHAVTVRIGLRDHTVMTGSVIELILNDRIATSGFAVPEAALTASLRGLWRVYVLLPVESGLYQIEPRDLQLRYLNEREAFVEGGLRDGERIVASGAHRVVPGQLVKLTPGSA
ncbi:MAG: RND family efflux transporter MFP subunit [Bacteroidia bacterium]|jgi:RND family efflux transporter MFP subunit